MLKQNDLILGEPLFSFKKNLAAYINSMPQDTELYHHAQETFKEVVKKEKEAVEIRVAEAMWLKELLTINK